MTSSISEDAIQIAFKNWCDKQDFILTHWHVPNGLKSSAYDCNRMKKMGLTRGVLDYWVLLSNKKLIVIEFKTKVGKLSDEQIKFMDTLNYCEIPCKVCRSAFEATTFVREQMNS